VQSLAFEPSQRSSQTTHADHMRVQVLLARTMKKPPPTIHALPVVETYVAAVSEPQFAAQGRRGREEVRLRSLSAATWARST